uniref:Integrase, catalytic region, zinc finger, CCHC-type, peptidase aspartic, catalytic n=1 Tax=Tanacetum cinerariifolium TaxID=118510 RepID=A0A6L2KF95_TANCI|nr:hypothetical protein [Tanacetum cinerariifolium]
MIYNMDSIGKYMREIILHQQRTPQMLKQKKLMQTQEDYSNPIKALNVDSLKVDLVVIQNTCFEKEDSNSETASSKFIKESSLDYATKDVHAIKYKIDSMIKRVNKRQMHTQESKVDTGKAVDVDLLSQKAVAQNHKCKMTAQGQQHTEQPEIINEEQHGQILNETSNKAKIKKEISALETINIELEHSVATLLKENKTLKKHYKDLYDSIKIARSKTIEQTTFLLANNADLKAHIQKKVFAIAALKNDLRKLKGNSVDTKFAKTSVLGKPVLQSLRNQSVVRQPNAFKSERPQITTDGSKPKPKRTNHSTRSFPVSKSSCVMIAVVPIADHSKNSNSFSDSKHFVCSTCHKCVFNANHDACITTFLKKVNSHATIQSSKTRNSNKPVEQKSHTQKASIQIFKGHRFSPNKTSAVYEKTSPRYNLRWKPMGRIFKTVGLRWVPTGKILASCTSKDGSEPTHGLNVDIPNIHESKQTLDLSAGTTKNVKPDNLRFKPRNTMSTKVPISDMISMTSMIELESLFGPSFDEYFNGENQVGLKSFAVTTADVFDKRQQQPDSTSCTSTLASTVTADGNINL